MFCLCSFSGNDSVVLPHKGSRAPSNICNIYFISDDDECTTGEDDCDDNAICTNTVGSFTCACKLGYIGDGKSCTGLKLL